MTSVYTNFYQLHMICKNFDANFSLEVVGIFLDMLKPFHRAWNDGVLFNPKILVGSGKHYGLHFLATDIKELF